jgi:hypothetical protein
MERVKRLPALVQLLLLPSEFMEGETAYRKKERERERERERAGREIKK